MLLLLILVGQGTILSTTLSPGAVFADLSIGSLHLYCCYHYIQSYNQHSHAYCCRNEKIIDSVIFFKCLVPSLSIAFSLLPKLRADTDWSNNNPVTRPDQAKHNYKLNVVVVVVVDLVTCWHWHYLLTTEQWSGGARRRLLTPLSGKSPLLRVVEDTAAQGYSYQWSISTSLVSWVSLILMKTQITLDWAHPRYNGTHETVTNQWHWIMNIHMSVQHLLRWSDAWSVT